MPPPHPPEVAVSYTAVPLSPPGSKYGGLISSACNGPGCGSGIATAVSLLYVVVDKLSARCTSWSHYKLDGVGGTHFLWACDSSVRSSVRPSSGVAYVIPWPLLVNQGFYIPKCLYSRVDFKNGSCHFFF